MSNEQITHSLEQISERIATTNNRSLKGAIEDLGKAISVGNIGNSTGVAIGRNIRMIVNQLNLPADTVAGLLGIRNDLRGTLGLDPNRYRIDVLLADKTREFVGRTYVFDVISEFLSGERSGYLVITGDPGLGKSSTLAEYVRRTGCISHFNIRSIGINTVRQFLENVCTQMIVDFGLPYSSLPAEAVQDGAFLQRLLKEASAKLLPEEQLVIVVDALDEVDLTSQPAGANILYLPSTLPDNVYFILTRRDLELPLVVQSPQRELNLMAHPAENRRDVESYIQHNSERPKLRQWIARQNMTEQSFISKLAELSESNFMYLRYVLPELESGVFQNLDIENLPAGLQGYYEDHWRHMGMTAKPLPRVKIRIIYIMCEVRRPVSRKLISEFATDQVLQVDEESVQEVLDEWKEFMHKQVTSDGDRFSLYHSSFRDFLHRKRIVQAAGVSIKDIKSLIADNLWSEVFGES